MATCETCGNENDKTSEMIADDEHHTFDRFERAIQALAPGCPHCGSRVMGYGMENEDRAFCWVHCGRGGGDTELRDRG